MLLNNKQETSLVYQQALKYLSYSAQSVFQLKKKLQKKGFQQQAIDKVIEKLSCLGYLNDIDYAQRLAEKLLKHKLYGLKHIRQVLKQKGIPDGIALKVLTDFTDDEEESARLLVKKKALPLPLGRENAAKLAGYLYRRGFSSQIIKKVITMPEG
jgi:regulatory protein